MQTLIQNLSNGAWHLARFICLLSMMILAPVIFANVISRYIFDYSLAWSSEVGRYSFLWLTFMGTAVALRDGSHAKIDLITDKLPLKLKKAVALFAYMIIIILSFVLIITGSKQVVSVWDVHAAYMQFLSMGWMYMSIPLLGILMLIFSIEKLMYIWLNREHTGA